MPISVGVEKARGLESDHSTGHFQIKLFGQKGILCDTTAHCSFLQGYFSFNVSFSLIFYFFAFF